MPGALVSITVSNLWAKRWGSGGADGRGEWQAGTPIPGAARAPEPVAAPGAAARILTGASSVLVIDWPNRDVPATLAFAGSSRRDVA
jgi:hypothetical protein